MVDEAIMPKRIPIRRELSGLRASELARCPLQCALRAWHQPAERLVAAERHLLRGQVFGWIVFQQFRRKYGGASVGRELAIPWGPDGRWTGHADIVVWPERLIVEVVSSVSPNPILTAKFRQCQQYLHFAQQAGLPFNRGAVYVINPGDLDREELIHVQLTRGVREEIDEDVRQVVAAIEGTGPLPDCRALSPDQCQRELYCQFTEQAWADWEEPEAVDLSDSKQAVALAEQLDRLQLRRRERKAADEIDDDQEQQLREELLALGLQPGLDYLLGPIKVRLSEVAGRQTFSLARAKEAGAWLPGDDERFSDFLRIGEPGQRWTVRRTEHELPEGG